MMINEENKILRLKEEHNNVFDTDEILWLLKGSENISAKEFVCKKILCINSENIMDVFEYMN